MGKSSKVKKNKVPKIGDKEYADYINFLKTSESEHEEVSKGCSSNETISSLGNTLRGESKEI